jgi:cytoskeletal protein RodZ
MATVAEQLRLAREAQKLTVVQVAGVTNIRTDHLRALEEGNYNVFSAPVYIRGFVRTYATLLKLDVPKILADLEAELGKTDRFREPPPLSEHRKGILDFITLQLSKVNWRVASVVLASLAIALIVGAIYYFHHRPGKADPLAHLPPATYSSPQSGETAPLPPTHH